MARSVKNVKLDTRTARQKLKQNKNPYWVRIDRNAHIGYRKGSKGGYWIARLRTDDGFKMQSIGTADDTRDSDGVEVLDFFQAQQRAREWLEHAIRAEKGIGVAKYTVNHALDDYIDYMEAHSKSAKQTSYTIEAYIRPQFGRIIVNDLTFKKISDWHKKLTDEKPRQRSQKGQVAFKTDAEKNEDYQRKRKSSANRVLTVLKAALNRAYNEGKVANDDAWRRVKPFKNVDHPKIRFLTLGECGRLVNACSKDFQPMVKAGLLTGCRYGELTNLRVEDHDQDTGTVFIRDSKNGKLRHIILEAQGQRFFSRQVIGKKQNDLIFTREDGEQWGRSHQTRRLTEACQRSQISPAVSFHILRHTHASQLVQKGVPMPVIAAQLGNSVQICEKHYAHLAPNYIADTIRANFPDMQIVEEDNIISMDKTNAK